MIRLARIVTIVLLVANSVVGQTASSGEIVPGDNLVVDGVPKIPSAIANAVGRYRNSYGYPLAGWDPSKREVWLKILASTGTWVSRVDTPGSIAKPLISVPDGGAYDVYYQPQGKYLVYNRDTAGDENFQFYLYDIAAHESKLLTDGKSRNTEPVWSNAGDRIIYSSSPPNGDGVDLSIIKPLEPRSNRLLVQGRGHYLKAYDWSPDDRKVVYCDFASNILSTLWTLDVATGETTLLSPKGESAGEYYDYPQFSKDGRGVYVVTDRGSELRRLAFVDLATKRPRYLSDHIKWDVEDFKVAPDGKIVAFVTNEDGVSRLHLLDSTTCKESAVPSLPIGIISDLKWHNNSVDLAFNFKSPQTPNDIYSADELEHGVARTACALRVRSSQRAPARRL